MLAKRYDKNGKKRRSVRFLVAEAKLEAEYIRRFLGQLTALEESRLCEFKYGLQNTHKVSVVFLFFFVVFAKYVSIFVLHVRF